MIADSKLHVGIGTIKNYHLPAFVNSSQHGRGRSNRLRRGRVSARARGRRVADSENPSMGNRAYRQWPAG